MWTLESGLGVVRTLQTMTRNYNYHLAIGGSVINRGLSDKDLDLYLLPLDNGNVCDSKGVIAVLTTVFGEYKPIGSKDGYVDFSPTYTAKITFPNHGQRIDVFIV